MNSLQSTQDFLTQISLCWSAGRGSLFVAFAAFRLQAHVARSVQRAMALIVLAAICFLACVFLLFVLLQWMGDTKRKTTNRPEVDSKAGEEKRPPAVTSRRTVERRDRFKVGARRLFTTTERPGGRGSWHDERERIAYERIAGSFKPGTRR
jgi:hypothetical protein